ncbi:hypothetical protein AAFF_G00271310 [Aldrovandia affinis]|uniref:Uncharacterized protein n=1 Tax=Aldrovandia affinis TaxID=143900 RepID=A0AAD7RDI8_9TELE|nr:hypothetical protein AAFF_G00271310 [Aldrovandia affinis]
MKSDVVSGGSPWHGRWQARGAARQGWAEHLGTVPDSPPSCAQEWDSGHLCQLGCRYVPLAVASALSLTPATPAD